MKHKKKQKQNGTSLVKEFLDSYLGNLVSLTKKSWNHSFSDYLFHSLSENNYSIYTISFYPKDVEKIVITADNILIVLKEKQNDYS